MRDIEGVVSGIVCSDEPPVVLSSLARASNPAFSDACAIELSEGTESLFEITFPLPDDTQAPVDKRKQWKSVATPFQASSGHGFASFVGVVTHSWAERDPTEDDAIIARLLVDHALDVLQRQRMARALARADERAAKLAIELITSRPGRPRPRHLQPADG